MLGGYAVLNMGLATTLVLPINHLPLFFYRIFFFIFAVGNFNFNFNFNFFFKKKNILPVTPGSSQTAQTLPRSGPLPARVPAAEVSWVSRPAIFRGQVSHRSPRPQTLSATETHHCHRPKQSRNHPCNRHRTRKRNTETMAVRKREREREIEDKKKH